MDHSVQFITDQGEQTYGERLFARACTDRTRGNAFKQKENRFKLDINLI